MQLSQYKEKAVLTNGEVLDIRRKVMDTAKVAKHDAEALMRLNENISTPTEAWKTLFSDAIVDYVVDASASSGYIVAENKASWLIAAVDADQKLDPETEFSLLIKILNKANIVSSNFESYMLKAVKDAVLKGEGFWAKNRKMDAGRIGEDDVELLRKIMYSVGGEGGIDISTAEAEVIYDIHDATVDADNHESWDILFGKMMACFMMGGASSHEINAGTAGRRDQWLKSDEGLDWSNWNVENVASETGGFLSAVFSIFSFTSKHDAEVDLELTPRIQDHELQSSLQAVTSNEAQWLINRVNRDGHITNSEVKMLKYIQQESPNLHASLDGFIKSKAR